MLCETFHIFNLLVTYNELICLNEAAEFYLALCKGEPMLFYSDISSATNTVHRDRPPCPLLCGCLELRFQPNDLDRFLSMQCISSPVRL